MSKLKKDSKHGVICPHCGIEGRVWAAYSERVDYRVLEAYEDDVSIDESSGYHVEGEFCHIVCEACHTYWDTIEDFHKEANKSVDS